MLLFVFLFVICSKQDESKISNQLAETSLHGNNTIHNGVACFKCWMNNIECTHKIIREEFEARFNTLTKVREQKVALAKRGIYVFRNGMTHSEETPCNVEFTGLNEGESHEDRYEMWLERMKQDHGYAHDKSSIVIRVVDSREKRVDTLLVKLIEMGYTKEFQIYAIQSGNRDILSETVATYNQFNLETIPMKTLISSSTDAPKMVPSSPRTPSSRGSKGSSPSTPKSTSRNRRVGCECRTSNCASNLCGCQRRQEACGDDCLCSYSVCYSPYKQEE
jgi:hypothetical protein